MMQQGISLPPQVQGSSTKGSLELNFSNLNWTSTSKPRPQHLFARITWWGDASTTQHDIPLYYAGDSTTFSSIQFPLVSSAPHIARYFSDMAALEISILQVEAAPKAIAKVTVNTAAIANAGLATFHQAVPVVGFNNSAEVLGSIQIKLDINYKPALPLSVTVASSSFGGTRVVSKPVESVGQEVAAALESLHINIGKEQGDVTSPLDKAAVAAPRTEQHSAVTFGLEKTTEILDTPAMEPSLQRASPPIEQEQEEEINKNDVNHDDTDAMQTSTTQADNQNEYSVFVRVDSAFELLPPPEQPHQQLHQHAASHTQSASSFVYASVVWQRDRSQRVHTHLTASQEVPVDPFTSHKDQPQQFRHAAVWRSELELKVTLAPFIAAVTAELNNSHTLSILDGPLLLINVWRSGRTLPYTSEEHAALIEELTINKSAAKSTPFDQLVGCAAIDLSALLHDQKHQQLEGRFPLVSAQHQVQGVVKASVMPNTHLAAALDLLQGNNSLGTDASTATGTAAATSSAGFNFTTENIYQPHQPGKKQQYAWSGSDSDDEGDAMAMVGVSFEGAVSCSDHEEEEEDEMDIEGEEKGMTKKKKKKSGLISQDWMFDICKNVGNMEEEEEEEQQQGGIIFSRQQEEELVAVKEKKPVLFKNRLLPGVVPSARDVPYLNASDFGGGGSSNRGADGGGGGGTMQQQQDASLPMLSQAATAAARISRAPPPPTHLPGQHHGLNGDWMFGIQQQHQHHQPEQQHRRPPPPEVTANQFAPMTNLPK